MKIEIEIPDWVGKEKRAIWIMAGIEAVASKMPWEDFWEVKTGRCSSCGRCCKKISCKHLIDNQCRFSDCRPFSCCIYKSLNIKECTQKFERVY